MKKSLFLLFLPALILASCAGNEKSTSEKGSELDSTTSVGGNDSTDTSTGSNSYVSGEDAQGAKEALMTKVMVSLDTLDWDSFKLLTSFDAEGLLSFMPNSDTFVTISDIDVSLNLEFMASLNKEVLGNLDFETLVGDEDLAKMSLTGNADFACNVLVVDGEEVSGGSVNGSFDGKITYGRQSLKAPEMEEAKESDWFFAAYNLDVEMLENGEEEPEIIKQNMSILSDDVLPAILDSINSDFGGEYGDIAPAMLLDDFEGDEEIDPMMMFLAMIYESASIAQEGNTYFVKVELSDIFDLLMSSDDSVYPAALDDAEEELPTIEGSIVVKFDFDEEDGLNEIALTMEDAKIAYADFIDLELSFEFSIAKTEEVVTLVSQAEVDALGENLAYVPGEYLLSMFAPDEPDYGEDF